MKLYLGVTDVPEPEGDTTYIVAEELEKNYALYSTFFKVKTASIVKEVNAGMNADITAMIRGVKVRSPYALAGQVITDSFKQYINTSEAENQGTRGVPTQAAKDGLTLRTKTGKKIRKHKNGEEYKIVQNAPRPSFIYSGVFVDNIKCWIK